MNHRRPNKSQTGATLVEFIIAAPAVLFLGLGSLQAGLIYHGKTTLNYATFEAARAGAVDHAQLDSMKNELGYRLAPIAGGDGTAEKATKAIKTSIAAVNLPFQTKLEILNPTIEAFDDWGEMSLESGVRAIPNSHLRNRNNERNRIGAQSGLNLHDANLLKIKVTHGFKMEIPFIANIFSQAMALYDRTPAHAHYYALKQIPITSVVTVRMQNEAWESQIIARTGVAPFATDATDTNQVVGGNQPASTPASISSCDDPYGLSGHSALMSSVSYPAGQDASICGTNAFENNSITDVMGGVQGDRISTSSLSAVNQQGSDGCS